MTAAAVLTADPDVNAFTSGFEVGLFAALVAVAGLLVLATVRRLIEV
jgi:hypothetical protein